MKATDRYRLINRINTLEGLTDDERSALLGLLRESKTYGLVWEEKPEDVEERQRNEIPVLIEDKERALTEGGTDAPNHILIEGDNLNALATLAYTHAGKIDVIYIDPPYNTGNEDFSYNDNYVDADDDYKHSMWLSFMKRRLRIAKKLLSPQGVIFISIDDNEIANLILLCNDKDLFGEQNHVATICRQAIKGGSRATNIKTVHDYILIYAKRFDSLNQFTGEGKEQLSLELCDEKGSYTKGRELNKWGAGSRREDSPSMWFPIPGPNGIEVYPIRNDGSEGRWRWGKKKLLQAVKDNDVIFELRENGTYIAYEKIRSQKSTTKQFNTWFGDNYINAKGSEAVKSIFQTLMSIFTYAKPVELIKDLVFMANFPNGTILDFFAGSGTALQAVMQLNADDGGKRTCILCQAIEKDKNGEDKHICENVTYERNKRVIQGYTKPNGEEVAGLANNNLRYYHIDFVGRNRSIKNMRRLVNLSTDMLCIKENLYAEQKIFAGLPTYKNIYRYFEYGDKKMLIIYNERYVDEIVKMIASMETTTKIKIYVFSPSEDPWEASFEPVSDKVELCALPQSIYNTYKRILPKRRQQPIETMSEEDVLVVYDEEISGLLPMKGGEE